MENTFYVVFDPDFDFSLVYEDSISQLTRATNVINVFRRLGTQGVCEMVWMGAGDLSLLI